MKMIETYRGTVFPWECDFFNHLNVRHYVAKFDEATWQFMAHFGMTPTYFKETDTAIFTVEQHVKYRRELFAADLVVVKSRLLQVNERSVKFQHVLYKAQLQEIAAEMTLTSAHIELFSRKSTTFPKAIYDQMLETLY